MPGPRSWQGRSGTSSSIPRGPRCGCGRRGCVEAFAGGVALLRAARTLPSGNGERKRIENVAELFVRARAGHPSERQIVDQAAVALGFAFAAIGAVLEPELIVVGGSLALGQPAFIRSAARMGARRRIAESRNTIRVSAATLGDAAVLLGALLRAQDDLETSDPGIRTGSATHQHYTEDS
ncbi:MAG: ROK family protein [Chloroflexota bacterium]